MKNICVFLIFFISFFLSGCVESQKFVVLENRVAAIEMENNRQLTRKSDAGQQQLIEYIEAIEKRLDQRPGITKEEYAEIKYEIQIIKEHVQRLEGRVQEISYNLDQYTQTEKQEIEQSIERLDHAVSKNYEKVLRLEKYMGFEPSAAGQPESQAENVIEQPAENAEQKLYDLAKKLFDDGDRENARIQFENFINKYPESDNADNARFWIADSYYAEKWFEKAILEYQKVLESYPDSNKLAASRLKQGYAFAELGETANARLILKELIKKHPDSNEAKYATEKLKSLN